MRVLGGLALAAATLLAGCSNGYHIGPGSYPGNGGPGGYSGSAGSGGASGSSGSGGGSGSSGTAGTTGSGSSSSGGTSGASSGGNSGGSSGSTSGGSTAGGPNQLTGALAFPVASAGEFLTLLDGGTDRSQIEFDLSSFTLDCIGSDGGVTSTSGLTLQLNLVSGDPAVAMQPGTYFVFGPPDGGVAGDAGIASAAATLVQTDGHGGVTVEATAESGGNVQWATKPDGTPFGSLFLTMSASGGTSQLNGTFVAPYCGSF
jgi:hypothetical protein